MNNNNNNIALIAGEGSLPVAIAEKLAEYGRPLIMTMRDPEPFRPYAGKLIHAKMPNLSRCVREIKAFGADTLIMAGSVPKRIIYYIPLLFDKLTRSVITQRRRDDHSLLGSVVRVFEEQGIKVIPYWQILPEFIASEGVLASRSPTSEELDDINYGRDILKITLPCSFGQAVVVAGRSVIAVEAMEGTDAMISRAGSLIRDTRRYGVVVKMMKKDQDMRYDLPTIGIKTIEGMHDAGLTCLAVEAGRTIIIEPEKTLKLADKYNIAVTGIKSDD